ncbi:MAG: hypothetical protein ACI9RV_001390, partial [Glaciecola sp.]
PSNNNQSIRIAEKKRRWSISKSPKIYTIEN